MMCELKGNTAFNQHDFGGQNSLSYRIESKDVSLNEEYPIYKVGIPTPNYSQASLDAIGKIAGGVSSMEFNSNENSCTLLFVEGISFTQLILIAKVVGTAEVFDGFYSNDVLFRVKF